MYILSGPLSVHQPTQTPGAGCPKVGTQYFAWSPVCLLYPILSSSSGGSCNFHWGGVRIWELPETDVDHSSVHRYLFFFRWPFVSFGVAWLFTTIEAKHFSPTDLGNFEDFFKSPANTWVFPVYPVYTCIHCNKKPHRVPVPSGITWYTTLGSQIAAKLQAPARRKSSRMSSWWSSRRSHWVHWVV